MTVVASATCTEIPEALRTRTYEMSISPSSNSIFPPNTHFDGMISGASLITVFAGLSNRLGIGVAGRGVVIAIDFDGPLIVEQIDPRTYLAIDGTGAATVDTLTGSTIAAGLDGIIQHCLLKADGSYTSCLDTERMATGSSCVSKNHQLILRRRT